MVSRTGHSGMARRVMAVWLAAASLAAAGEARGQAGGAVSGPPTPPDVGGLSLEDILGVEVQSVFGASKFLQKITDAPAAITVVTADEIARYGWLTLSDVLRSVRGFYVTDDRSYAYVGARGFLRPGDYTSRLLILVDGLRLNDNVFDQALVGDDFQIDLRDVERIEVIRGPSSSLYGSNAFFGVVNVITRRPSPDGRTDVTLDSGTLAHRGARVALSKELRSGVGLALSASGHRTGGVGTLWYPEYGNSASAGVAAGIDGSERTNVFARLRYRSLAVNGSFNRREKTIPTGAYGTVFNDPRHVLTDDHAAVNVAWSSSLAGGWQGRVRGGFDDYGFYAVYPYFENDDAASGRTVEYIDRADGRWLTGEVQASRTVGARHRFTTGVERRQHLRQNQTAYVREPYSMELDVPRRSATTAWYAQDEFRVHRTLLLSGGVRYDHYGQFASPVKPRLAAILQPGGKTALKAIYGTAFRAPNVFESYYLIPGRWKERPQLAPEQIHTLEFVAEHYYGSRVRLEGTVFSNHVHDLIDFTTDPKDALVWFTNHRHAGSRGVELEAEAKWPGGSQGRISYTHSRASMDDGTPLTNSPRHIVQFLSAIPVAGGTFLALDGAWLSSRLSRSGDRVSAYLRPNVTWSGPLFERRLRFALTLANVTNTSFADPVGDDFRQDVIPQNGRTARLQLTWSF